MLFKQSNACEELCITHRGMILKEQRIYLALPLWPDTSNMGMLEEIYIRLEFKATFCSSFSLFVKRAGIRSLRKAERFSHFVAQPLDKGVDGECLAYFCRMESIGLK